MRGLFWSFGEKTVAGGQPQGKLILILGGVAAALLLIAGIGLAIFDGQLYQEQKLKEVTVQANILAASTTASLVFDDAAAAQEYVDSLRANPEIEAAGVYNDAEVLVASYVAGDRPPPPRMIAASPPVFDDNTVTVVQPVNGPGGVVGSVYIRAVTEPFVRRVPRYGGIVLLVIMGWILAAVLVTSHSALARVNSQLETRASELAAANVNLVTEVKEREKTQEALRHKQSMIADLGVDALGATSFAGLIDRAAAVVAKVLDVEFSNVVQRLPHGTAGRLVAGVGWRKDAVGQMIVPLDPAVPVEKRFSSAPLWAERGIVSGASVAIGDEKAPWGMLGAYSRRPRAFTPDDLNFLKAIANVIADAIQREASLEALRRSEVIVQIAAKAAHLGGWMLDLSDNIMTWSDEAAALHEMQQRSQLPLLDVLDLYEAPYHDRIRRSIELCGRNGTPFDEELLMVTPSHRRVWLRAIGQPAKDGRGVITHVQGAFQDITEWRDLEAKLRQSQRLEAVGQLTGGIAHDFNNLLTVILGNAERLAGSSVTPADVKHLADMIVNAASRGAELNHRLLAFARQQVLAPQIVDIGKLLERAQGLLRRSVREDVDISIICADQVWPAFVDTAQLESAVLNLCINAGHAMPNGGSLTIEVANSVLDQSAAEASEDAVVGEYVLVSVTDTGTGMPPDVVARAFEPFFTTKGVGKGSGLGLSMVYGFVKQSGGQIKIHSTVGQGTSVKLYLPRPDKDQPSVPAQAAEPKILYGSEKILVVEDDELVREYVSDQLLRLGYQVTCFNNGRDALDAIRQNVPFDLLFTDVIMPGGLNGLKLAEEAQEIKPRIRVLFTSGYSDNTFEEDSTFKGNFHFLSKPYSTQQLASKLRFVLNEQTQAAPQDARTTL